MLGVDIISMEVPEVAESGKDLVLDCNYDYRYHNTNRQSHKDLVL